MVVGEGQMQGLDYNTITTETKYSKFYKIKKRLFKSTL